MKTSTKMKAWAVLCWVFVVVMICGIGGYTIWSKYEDKRVRVIQGADVVTGLYNVGDCFTWPPKANAETWEKDEEPTFIRVADVGRTKYRLQIWLAKSDQPRWIDGKTMQDMTFDNLHRYMIKTHCPSVRPTQGQTESVQARQALHAGDRLQASPSPMWASLLW